MAGDINMDPEKEIIIEDHDDEWTPEELEEKYFGPSISDPEY
jgi:hypothetical protein